MTRVRHSYDYGSCPTNSFAGAGIAVPIGSEVADKTGQTKQVPPEVVRRVVADLRQLMDSKAQGFETVTAIGRTLGVAQPSVTAWFGPDAGLSWTTLDKIEDKLEKDYAGRGRSSPDARERSNKWRALERLSKDGYDVAKAFVAVNEQQFDRSRKDIGWDDYYDGAKTTLDGGGEPVAPKDIPKPKGTPKPRKR